MQTFCTLPLRVCHTLFMAFLGVVLVHIFYPDICEVVHIWLFPTFMCTCEWDWQGPQIARRVMSNKQQLLRPLARAHWLVGGSPLTIPPSRFYLSNTISTSLSPPHPSFCDPYLLHHSPTHKRRERFDRLGQGANNFVCNFFFDKKASVFGR